MADENLSAVLYPDGNIRLENMQVPEPGPGQVQLSIQNVGICGSDTHMLQHGTCGDFKVESPLVLGHEVSGTVTKLGHGVTNLSVGDKVAVEPLIICGICSLCKKGRYNLCEKLKICGIPPTNGCMTRFYVHPADMCFKLPDHVSLEEGALMEPLSVALQACRKAGVTLGSKVLICGAGPLGLMALLTVKAFGSSQVCVTGLGGIRLELAKTLGATYTLNVKDKEPKEIARMVEQCFGDKPEIAIECTLDQSSVRAAIYATKSGGLVMTLGVGTSDVALPLTDATMREVDVLASIAYTNCFPTAIELVASGKVNVKPLITHRYKLEDAKTALQTARAREGVKVLINCAT